MGKFIILQIPDGFKFHLKAKNGEIIATSPAFVTTASCKRGIIYMQEIAPHAAIEDQTIPDYEKIAAPKFEIYKGMNKSFYFKLRTTDEDTIACSKPYTSKANCIKGIESVKANAATSEIYETLT